MPLCNPWKTFGSRIRKTQYAKKEFPNIAAGSKRDAAKFMLEADGKFDGLLKELFGEDEILVTTSADVPQSGIKIFGVDYKGVKFSGSYDRDSQCVLTVLGAWKKSGPEIDVGRDKMLFRLDKVSSGRYAFEGEMGLEGYERLAKPYLENPVVVFQEAGTVKIKGEIDGREAIGPILRNVMDYGGTGLCPGNGGAVRSGGEVAHALAGGGRCPPAGYIIKIGKY